MDATAFSRLPFGSPAEKTLVSPITAKEKAVALPAEFSAPNGTGRRGYRLRSGIVVRCTGERVNYIRQCAPKRKRFHRDGSRNIRSGRRALRFGIEKIHAGGRSGENQNDNPGNEKIFFHWILFNYDYNHTPDCQAKIQEIFLFQISSRWEILNPSQIPARAPTPLKKIEDSEKTLPPQSTGTYPPAIDPTTSPAMMKVLDIKFFLCGD